MDGTQNRRLAVAFVLTLAIMTRPSGSSAQMAGVGERTGRIADDHDGCVPRTDAELRCSGKIAKYLAVFAARVILRHGRHVRAESQSANGNPTPFDVQAEDAAMSSLFDTAVQNLQARWPDICVDDHFDRAQAARDDLRSWLDGTLNASLFCDGTTPLGDGHAGLVPTTEEIARSLFAAAKRAGKLVKVATSRCLVPLVRDEFNDEGNERVQDFAACYQTERAGVLASPVAGLPPCSSLGTIADDVLMHVRRVISTVYLCECGAMPIAPTRCVASDALTTTDLMDGSSRRWTALDFDEPGFMPNVPNSTDLSHGLTVSDSRGTEPANVDRYYRCHFDLPAPLPDDVKVFVQCNDGCEVYLNDNRAPDDVSGQGFGGGGSGARHADGCVNVPGSTAVPGSACSPNACVPTQVFPANQLRATDNVLAIHVSNGAAGLSFSASVFTGDLGTCGSACPGTVDAGEQCDPTTADSPCANCRLPGISTACTCPG